MKKKIFLLLIAMMVFGYAIMPHHDNSGEKMVNLNITNIKDTVKKVALTFDDGPNRIYTKTLLDGLKERNVKVTFFVAGNSIEGNEDLIIRMYKEGHLIGNHTYNHVDLSKTEFKKACSEINDTNAYIYNLTGYMPKFIRPPYGAWTNSLKKETDMSIVLWNVDPEDWKDQNASVVANRIIRNTRSGDIVLIHDIFKTSVVAALKVIDVLQGQGYIFVTVDKLNSTNVIK